MRSRRRTPPRRHAQQGAVVLMFALSLVMLMGMAGLALDGARLYVNKTELQNAADACALAAAEELDATSALVLADFNRARDAGRLVGSRNRSDFHSQAVPIGNVMVRFASTANAVAWSEAGAAAAGDRIVRCTVAPAALSLWLMPIIGINEAEVSAVAVASRLTPGSNCALPPGLCGQIPSLWQ